MPRITERPGAGRASLAAVGVLLAGLVLLAGCSVVALLPELAIPVAYRSVTLETGDRGALHAVAGLYVELENVSERTITSVELAFDLYRNGDPLPAAGANSFSVAVETRLDAGEIASFCVSLDAVSGAGDDGVVARRVRARSVVFEDGSRWRNTGSHVYEETAS